MNRWNRLPALLLALLALASGARPVLAEGNGQNDFDEALRVKVTAENLRDLNQVVELLESAIEKGLDVENNDSAEQMLVEALMERATQLSAAVQGVPTQRLADPAMQRVRGLAVSDLRRVIEYDDAPPQAKMMLSELLTLPGGDPKEALKLLDELFEEEAVAAMSPKMRAKALALRGMLQMDDDPDKALADFNAAIELEPAEPEHRLARADFYQKQGKLDEAVADIEAVIASNPEMAGAYLVKSELLRRQEKFDDALASLAKASELAPSAPGPYQQRGEIYKIKGDFPKAIEQFDKVLQLQPGLVLTLLHRAEAYLFNKQEELALADIEAVIKANPDLTVAHGLRAQALASKERLPEAIAEMKLLADAEPEQSDYRMQLALYYLVAKQPRAAIAEYTELLNRDADNLAALRARADAYLTIGDHAAAVADFDKAYKLEPTDSNILNNFAWVLATSPDDAVRDGKRAIELATKACEATEYKQSHILSTLAAAYAESGDFKTAQKWSQQAVDMNDPEHAEQLAKELASYKEKKPWRERQTQEEAVTPTAPPATEEKPIKQAPEETPATAEAPAKPADL